MIILEKPYVSDFLIETIKKNNFSVLDNALAREYFGKDRLVCGEIAAKMYSQGEKFYANSENAISWIDDNLENSELKKYIEISKNKALFRKTIAKMYPDYYFREVELSQLKNIAQDELKFPFVLKPTVGFLSFGVYPVKSFDDWQNVLNKLEGDISKLKDVFPKNVVDMTKFIMEEMIEGREFAIDAYFDSEGRAVILNIFEHPFFDDKDVSDRAYFTSRAIFKEYYDKFLTTLNKLSECLGFKNYPFHLELRADKDKIIPIELNPMRFCGWCITDIAHYAWGINVYEYFMKDLKPDWDNILAQKGNEIYYFTIGDMPQKADSVDYEGYLKNISNPLCIRKIDFKNNPIFAIVFAKTNSSDEIRNILKLDMNKYLKIAAKTR